MTLKSSIFFYKANNLFPALCLKFDVSMFTIAIYTRACLPLILSVKDFAFDFKHSTAGSFCDGNRYSRDRNNFESVRWLGILKKV